MGKMKVFVFVILAILLAAMSLLAACAPAPEEAPPEEVGLPVPPGKLPHSEQHYYFIAANLGDPFYADHLLAIADAAKLLGVKTEMVGPTDLSVAAQVKTFEEVLAKPGTAGIFLYPIEWAAMEPLVNKAISKGIPVTKAIYDPNKPYTSIIGPDYEAMINDAAEFTGKVLNGEGKVATVGISATALQYRVRVYGEYLAEHYPNIENVGNILYDGSVADHMAQTQPFMGAHPGIDLLFQVDGKGGEMSGFVHDNWPQVKYFTVDKSQIILEAIKAGRLIAGIGYNTYDEAYLGIVFAYYAYHNQPVPEKALLRNLIVTIDNVDEFLQ